MAKKFFFVCAGLICLAIGCHLGTQMAAAQTGAGGAVLGHPAVAVAWLANAVGQFGVNLSAGDVIMPGALCGAADVSAGDFFQATFDGLGSVSVRFI